MYLHLLKFDRSKNFKAILDMFQIFNRFVKIVEKNFNPDDAQNVRKRLN